MDVETVVTVIAAVLGLALVISRMKTVPDSQPQPSKPIPPTDDGSRPPPPPPADGGADSDRPLPDDGKPLPPSDSSSTPWTPGAPGVKYYPNVETYTNYQTVLKWRSGLIAPRGPDINVASTIAVEWDALPDLLYVDPYGKLNRWEDFVATTESLELVSPPQWGSWPSRRQIIEYVRRSIASEIAYEKWQPGNPPLRPLPGGRRKVILHGENFDDEVESTETAGDTWNPVQLVVVLLLKKSTLESEGVLWEPDLLVEERQLDTLAALPEWVSFPSTWMRHICASLKTWSCLSVCSNGITMLWDQATSVFGGDAKRFDHVFQGPFFVFILDTTHMAMRLWEFPRGNIEPFNWRVVALGTRLARLRDGHGPHLGDQRRFDIYMHLSENGIYWQPPLQEWTRKGLCYPADEDIMPPYLLGRGPVYGSSIDKGERGDIKEHWLLGVDRVLGESDWAEKNPNGIALSGWIRSAQAYRPARMFNMKFPSQQQRVAVYVSGSIGQIKRFAQELPGGMLGQLVQFPLPPTRIGESTSGEITRSTIRSEAFMRHSATLMREGTVTYWAMRAWVFFPELGIFWLLSIRPENFPEGYILQEVTAQWNIRGGPTKAFVITPEQPTGGKVAMYPYWQTIRDDFTYAYCTNLFDISKANRIASYWNVWPKVFAPDLTNFSSPGQISTPDFWPLGWFEVYDPFWFDAWKQNFRV